MNQIDIQQLRDWAAEYNRDKFIHSDPVQFPHRYSEAKDIEISAFLTAWISYGNRKCIITKVRKYLISSIKCCCIIMNCVTFVTVFF